jgi:hypothetical protein
MTLLRKTRNEINARWYGYYDYEHMQLATMRMPEMIKKCCDEIEETGRLMQINAQWQLLLNVKRMETIRKEHTSKLARELEHVQKQARDYIFMCQRAQQFA